MPRLTRRSLVAASALAFVPFRVRAQATPDVSARITYDDINGYQRGVGVSFQIADMGLGDVFGGSMVNLDAVALQFDHSSDARAAVSVVADKIEAYERAVVLGDPDFADATFRVAEVSAPDLGDEQVARSLIVEQDGTQSWAYGISVIAQDDVVQAIVGQAMRGAMSPTLDIAESIIDRWPGDDLSDALPTLDDVPEGMAEVDD